ncbi:serine/threonine protein kinase [Bifidobacterium callimiconis]|uniref:Serine/threonine protein kinase n=1 Tax=Bifidobacterium callimiconis TaxID=2306973 RepID=A0A430FH45_9BIFI|nr:serine/threonine protein kinase [Bifidobacterium callimiconis]
MKKFFSFFRFPRASKVVRLLSGMFCTMADIFDAVLFRMLVPVSTGRRGSAIIGGYRVTGRLGGGRYGMCLQAEDSEGRRVVLKRFRRGMWKRNAVGNHYEAVILSGLSHPAVPELLGVINDRSGYYFVLSQQPGITLKSWLFDRRKSFSRAEIYRIGTQLFNVLVYLHSRSVIHGDISLSNVMDDGKHASLIDFGLARYMSARPESGRAESDAHASGTGPQSRPGGSHEPETAVIPDCGGIDLDHARLADVLLYLMYSCDALTRQPGKVRGGSWELGERTAKNAAWYDELALTADQLGCMKRLIGLARPYASTTEASEAFRTVFADWQ